MSRIRIAMLLACTLLVAGLLAGCSKPSGSAQDNPGSTTSTVGASGAQRSGQFPHRAPPGFPQDLQNVIAQEKGSKIDTGSIISTPKVTGYSVQMSSPDGVDALTRSFGQKIRAAGYTVQSQGLATIGGKRRGFITFRKGANSGLLSASSDPKTLSGPSAILIQVIVPK